MLNKDVLQGHWKEARGKIKQEWGKFTDNDITQLKGTYEELEGLLQQRYGYAKEQADKAINEFINKNHWH
jgi:uncharacterized protein YjbJ (UPF0337 family)